MFNPVILTKVLFEKVEKVLNYSIKSEAGSGCSAQGLEFPYTVVLKILNGRKIRRQMSLNILIDLC